MPERRSVAAAFVAAFLVVSFAMPIFGLFRARPASFSWHMYSVSAGLPDVTVIDRSGAELAVDLDELLASRRAEVDYVPALVARLCAGGQIAAVRIASDDGEEERPCD